MDTGNEEWRIMHMQFIGKIIASFTHEVKNHLAFIKESAGLIGDIISSNKLPETKYFAQIPSITKSIEEQVKKSSEFCSRLNRFAHRMDSLKTSFNVNECIDDLIELMNRMANQKRITIDKNFERELSSVYSSPALLQLLIFCALEEIIGRLSMNTRITLKTASSNEKVSVHLIADGDEIPHDAPVRRCSSEFLRNIADHLHGTYTREGMNTIITLPYSSE
jgi:C4-dicarboxylate-specific signal transduction histidine kinase